MKQTDEATRRAAVLALNDRIRRGEDSPGMDDLPRELTVEEIAAALPMIRRVMGGSSDWRATWDALAQQAKREVWQ